VGLERCLSFGAHHSHQLSTLRKDESGRRSRGRLADFRYIISFMKHCTAVTNVSPPAMLLVNKAECISISLLSSRFAGRSAALGGGNSSPEVFFFLWWSGTQPTITEVTICPFVPVPDDDECGVVGGVSGKGKPKYSEKTCPSTRYHVTWPGLGPGPPKWQTGD
jgi:hypothetical protein